jgi:hypothetical protein
VLILARGNFASSPTYRALGPDEQLNASSKVEDEVQERKENE